MYLWRDNVPIALSMSLLPPLVLGGTMCPLPCQCRCCPPYFSAWYALLGCALGHCCSHVSPVLQGAEVLEVTMCPLPCQYRCCPLIFLLVRTYWLRSGSFLQSRFHGNLCWAPWRDNVPIALSMSLLPPLFSCLVRTSWLRAGSLLQSRFQKELRGAEVLEGTMFPLPCQCHCYPPFSCLVCTSWLRSGSLLHSRLPGTSRSWGPWSDNVPFALSMSLLPPLIFLLGMHFLVALLVIAAVTFYPALQGAEVLEGAMCALLCQYRCCPNRLLP